jgi:hypothetical protein
MFMFLLRKLMVLLALEQMVLICLPHLRFDEMVHPRYFVTSRSVLGPSLFLFYINDMPDGIQSIVRLFDDDTIAYVTISSDADAANLQQSLTEEVLNPLICFSCETIMFQLMNDKAMADLIKSFGKIHYETVCLFSLV